MSGGIGCTAMTYVVDATSVAPLYDGGPRGAVEILGLPPMRGWRSNPLGNRNRR